MKRYNGNETAAAGVYFNPREVAFTSLDEEGRLPGTAADAYYRVPVVAMLIVGPALGLAYAMFLPLIGFGALAWVGASKTAAVVGVPNLAPVLKPAWRPAMAFFTRNKPAAEKARGRDEWAEGIEKELEDDEPKDAA